MLAGILISACGGSKPSDTDDRIGLVFTRENGEVSEVWVAREDGSHARQIVANGWGEKLSPDGRWVTYSIPQGDNAWASFVKAVVKGDPQPLGQVSVLAWSPDSKHVAVRDDTQLLLADAETATTRKLASGAVGEASFSPDGQEIAFSRHNDEEAPAWRSDIFSIRLADDSVTQLTHDGHSNLPVWGPEWIAFRRFHYDGVWSVGELYLMRPDGSGARRLATGKEGPTPTFLGLDPLELSKDGTRLLACAATEFYCPPVSFEIPGGASHDLSIKSEAVTQALGLSENGGQVLASAGAFDAPHDLYAIPFEGGRERLLVERVSFASWGR